MKALLFSISILLFILSGSGDLEREQALTRHRHEAAKPKVVEMVK